MPGSESDPVQLDPFQEIAEVNWDLRALLVIDYIWSGTDSRDLDTVTTVGSFDPVGAGASDSIYNEGRSVIIWSGDIGSAETVEVWGREVRTMTGLGKVTVTCAAWWDETDAYEGQVFLTVTSYIKSRQPFTYGEERQRHETSLIIASSSPETLAEVDFNLRTGRFTVA